jgi:hypothetical protein
MKATRILASLILVAMTAGAANAQFIRCSWNSCDPQNSNQDFLGPAVYNLVLSVTGADAPNIGTDVSIFLYPDVPDAWRFDDNGCQTGTQLTRSNAAFNKTTCPTMLGGTPGPNVIYGYDPGSQMAQYRLVMTYDTFDPSPAIRYTIWQLGFDHTFSVAGPGSPPATCGGAERPLALELRNTQYLRADGANDALVVASSDVNPCTWNGGPVPAQPTTLGRVKAQYR